MARKPKIMPSQETLRRLFDYNQYTGSLVWKMREPQDVNASGRAAESACKTWNKQFCGKEALVTVSTQGYYQGPVFRKLYRKHRIIWKWMTGEDPEMIDHINGNRKDNRWENLRITDETQNKRNAKMSKRNTTGVVGVYWVKKQERWRASIGVNRKLIELGTFVHFDDAVKARKEAEKKYGFHQNHGRRRKLLT